MFAATPLWPKIGVFNLCFFETKNIDVEQTHKGKSGKKNKDKKKGISKRKQDNNKKDTGLMKKKLCNLIFWCCSFHETKAKKTEKERKREKHGTKRKQKKKDKKEERREQERDRERETEKGGSQKRLRRNKGDTQK